MEVYKAGRGPGSDKRRRGGLLRTVLLVLLLLLIAVLAYLLLPFGGQRVALLGSDASADGVSRSDTIVVARAGGGMVAVPRDTLVEIPGVGEDKINVAFAAGGPELTVETLESLTGLPIDNYVVVHFDGVQDIVDAMDGITVEVEEPIEVGIGGRPVSIPAGTQTGSGRGRPGGGAPRATPPPLPATTLSVWRNIETNMNPLQATRFAIQM